MLAGADPIAVWVDEETGSHTPLELALQHYFNRGYSKAKLGKSAPDYLGVADALVDWCSSSPQHKDYYYRLINKNNQDTMELVRAIN